VEKIIDGSSSWMRRLADSRDASLKGYRVEARDGAAGQVEQVLYWSDASVPDYIVVGTGRWFFGHKSVLSVQLIEDIDPSSRRIRMKLSRAEIREAPEHLPRL
jgi:hypothetical protein